MKPTLEQKVDALAEDFLNQGAALQAVVRICIDSCRQGHMTTQEIRLIANSVSTLVDLFKEQVK
jgi:hypothetical protein